MIRLELKIHMPGLILPVLLILLILGAAASTGVARAQEQRLYAGVTALASQLGASVDKRVDTRAPDTLVPEPRSGRLLHDRDTGETTAYGPGLRDGADCRRRGAVRAHGKPCANVLIFVPRPK